MSSDILIDTPADEIQATLLLAHGAGAPMDSEFMQMLAQALCRHGIRVLRFEFPYMAARRIDGRKRPPNPMPALLTHFRELLVRQPGPVFIGGKSMGGRVASLLAEEPGVSGTLCFGYPFHPPGKPDKLRTAHLLELTRPVLIVQGNRDPFGKAVDVAGYRLSEQVQLHWLESGDHDFRPLKASGRTQSQLIEQAAQAAAGFCRRHAGVGAV